MSGPSSSTNVVVAVSSFEAMLPAVIQVEVVPPSMILICIVPAAVVLPVVSVSPVKSASCTTNVAVTLPDCSNSSESSPAFMSPSLNGTG